MEHSTRSTTSSGFTLIEMLVAIAIFTILMIGLLNLLDNSTRISKIESALADTQENVRYATYHLMRTARMMGGSTMPFVRGGGAGNAWVAGEVHDNPATNFSIWGTSLDNMPGSDILILSEADGSFRSSDVKKFLAYIEDAGMVIGTRTTKQMVDQAARMNFIIRMANVLWAKILQMMWFFTNETRFTDVGCTYRALWKETYQKIRPGLRAVGPEFSLEMMAEGLRQKVKIVEIPVKYFQREGGESKHSVSYYHLAKTALKMLRTIVRKKLERSTKQAPS